MTDVTVVSTGYNVPHKAACLGSVAHQVGVHVEHRWVDASSQAPALTCSENLRRLIADLPADRIVAWVDLDDWLLVPHALARAAREHEAGAWATYGSFVYAEGQQIQITPYDERQWPDLRSDPWAATHVKTFRAGLFNAIKDEDLKLYGEQWLRRAVDVAVMLPILEMAGFRRTAFIPDPLYCYHFGVSTEHVVSEDELALERESVRYVRGRRPYRRLEKLP